MNGLGQETMGQRRNLRVMAEFCEFHQCFKMKSIRKLSNFNFQWTKTLYQNNFKHIAFFSTLFKGDKRKKLYEITSKKMFLLEPGKTNFKSLKF